LADITDVIVRVDEYTACERDEVVSGAVYSIAEFWESQWHIFVLRFIE
jgi:hypothetical protein